MSTESFAAVPVEVFGSLATFPDASDVPVGLSPDCQDVEYIPGGVRTRPGIVSTYTPISANPKINGLKSFVTVGLAQRLLVYTSDGRLYEEITPGTLSLVSSALVSGGYLKSTTVFGREYLGFSDGIEGIDMPRSFDDVNLDRVSQDGPGEGPTVVDFLPSALTVAAVSAAATIAASPTGAVEDATGSIATITTTAAHGFSIGDLVVISGVTNAAFNGTFLIASVPLTTTFTVTNTAPAPNATSGSGTAQTVGAFENTLQTTAWYATTAAHNLKVGWTVNIGSVTNAAFNGIFVITEIPSTRTFRVSNGVPAASASSGSGTATPQGTVTVGVHRVAVWFQTRTGSYTRLCPDVVFRAAGSKLLQLSNLPIGPANVIARLVAFTTAGGTKRFHMPDRMVVNDNTTTTLTVDFSDVGLASGTNVDYLLSQEVLPNCAGFADYSYRLIAWAWENRMQDWLNLSFDGGFSGGRALGWIADANNAGGSAESTDTPFGQAYKITGDGATATRGAIKQGALVDAFFALPLIQTGLSYTVRARVKRSAGLLAGRLNIDIFGTTGTAIDTVGMQVTAGVATTSYVEFQAELTPAQSTLSTDLVLRVFADQTPTNNEFFLVKDIRILPTAQLNDLSTVRISKANNPEAFDGATGLLAVAPNNGQALRTAFRLREFLYLVKERSLFVTQDDGINEPFKWTVEEVDAKVGTPSVHGVAVGEGFAVIAARSGLYFFNGGTPEKLTQEIQPLWDSINWAQGHKIWVQLNVEKKQVKVGVPIGAATQPNLVLTLDYTEGWGEPFALGEEGLAAVPRARKWTKWNLSANSVGIVERSTGSAQEFLGNNAANGKVYTVTPGTFNDDGAAITSYYRTAFLTKTGPTLKNLFGYLTLYGGGVGNLALSAYYPGDTVVKALPNLVLANPAPKDLQVTLNLLAERVSFKFGTNVADKWFQIAKFVPWAKPDPWAPVWGKN